MKVSRREFLAAGNQAAVLAATGIGSASLGHSATAHALSGNAGREADKPLFHVVIVGGGSAGAVLAARLSADVHRRVLLLEAGPNFAPIIIPRYFAMPMLSRVPLRSTGITKTRRKAALDMTFRYLVVA